MLRPKNGQRSNRDRVTVIDLPRNDIGACRRLWLDHAPSPEEWEMMLMLQDDPRQLARAAKRWRRAGPRR